jgi:hypothetical protein
VIAYTDGAGPPIVGECRGIISTLATDSARTMYDLGMCDMSSMVVNGSISATLRFASFLLPLGAFPGPLRRT